SSIVRAREPPASASEKTVACCACSTRIQADAVKPWLGRSRSEGLEGTEIDSLPENLAPAPIRDACVNTAVDFVGLFLYAVKSVGRPEVSSKFSVKTCEVS